MTAGLANIAGIDCQNSDCGYPLCRCELHPAVTASPDTMFAIGWRIGRILGFIEVWFRRRS
jgi:hypothetical protein